MCSLASRSRGREPGLREAALCTAGIVALGALFGLALAAAAGPRASGQFFAGWLTEYSLSLDNLFVFVLLIGRSAVPARLRSRVLLVGIGLALLLRAVFIAAGAAALNRFDWVLYVFGAMLLVTAVRLATATAGRPDPAAVSAPGRRARCAAGWPAASGGTVHGAAAGLAGAIALRRPGVRDGLDPGRVRADPRPAMVLAANVFALLGLRHLYYLIGGLLDRLAHLSAGLSAILAFIGVKLIIEALAESGVTPASARCRCRTSSTWAVVVRHRRRAGRGHRVQPASHPAQPGPAQLSPEQRTSSVTTSPGATFRVSPVSRSVSSTVPSASPRLPTVIRYGMPVSSASLNFTPARSGPVVDDHLDTRRGELLVERLAGRGHLVVLGLGHHDHHAERRHGQRPDDAALVVVALDDRRPAPAPRRSRSCP